MILAAGSDIALLEGEAADSIDADEVVLLALSRGHSMSDCPKIPEQMS